MFAAPEEGVQFQQYYIFNFDLPTDQVYVSTLIDTKPVPPGLDNKSTKDKLKTENGKLKTKKEKTQK